MQTQHAIGNSRQLFTSTVLATAVALTIAGGTLSSPMALANNLPPAVTAFDVDRIAAYSLHELGFSAQALSDPTPADVALARELLDDYGQALAAAAEELDALDPPADEDPHAVSTAAAGAGGSIAAIVGKAVLSSTVSHATGFGLDAVLAVFGFSDSNAEILSALQEIQASLDALHEKMDAVLDGIRALMDQNTLNAFNEAQQRVAAQAGRIGNDLTTYTMWLELGFEPPESIVQALAISTHGAVGELSGLLTEPASGTVDRLLAAASVEQDVSDLKAFWEQVLSYRDHYMVVQADALVLLDGLHRLNPDAGIDTLLAGAEVTVTETLEAIYDRIGLPMTQVEAGPAYVQVRYADWVFSHANRPEFQGEDWAFQRTRGELLPYLEDIRDAFATSGIGGSLESYFRDRGLATEYDFTDTFRLTTGGRAPNFWVQAIHDQARIRGNGVEIAQVTDGPTRGISYAWMAELDSEMARIQAELNPRAKVMTLAPGSGFGRNSGGRAARLDIDAIDAALYGIDGFEVEHIDEGLVEVAMPDPFGPAPVLRVVDAVSGEVFARFGRFDGLGDAQLPAGDEPDRVLLVQQGFDNQGQFEPWAESGLIVDGDRPVLVRLHHL